jgi:predicted RNA methylase
MPSAVSTPKVRLGNTRVTGKEQFYTPPALALELTESLAALIPDFASRTIVEPAGGTGAFITAAASMGVTRVQSWDIEPKHSSVKKGDFLLQELAVEGAVTLGNPPFGRNNSLSIPFFNHAADHSDYIAFIVPRSWRKWSVLNRLDRRFHLVSDTDIRIDYVDETGTQLMVKRRLATCFQIWERRAEPRPLVSVADQGLIAKTTPELADVSLTIFGYGCGTVKTAFERKPNSTQMFLKLEHPQALEALQKVDFSHFYRNTAYTEALSLQEINYLLNQEILGNPHLVEKV